MRTGCSLRTNPMKYYVSDIFHFLHSHTVDLQQRRSKYLAIYRSPCCIKIRTRIGGNGLILRRGIFGLLQAPRLLNGHSSLLAQGPVASTLWTTLESRWALPRSANACFFCVARFLRS